MKIVHSMDSELMTLKQAVVEVEDRINNTTKNELFVVKFDGHLVSFSGRYYKFAYKTLGNLKNALSQKFGAELAQALVEANVLIIEKVLM